MACAHSRIIRIVSITVAFFATSTAAAADTQTLPHSFTYQGSMYQADGVTPLQDQVDFALEIHAPTGTCLLYSERQLNVDLTLTGGIFSLHVGSSLFAAKRVVGIDPGYTMAQVFSNSLDFPPVPGSCPLGYHPSLGDTRILRVKTTPHSTGVQSTLNPDLTITSTPQAMVADTLQGHTPLELLLISNASSQLQVSQGDLELLFGPRVNGAVSPSDASALHHHDGRYAEIDSGGLLGLSGKLGTYAPGGGTAAGSLWYDQDNKAIKFYDGTSSHSLSTGGAAPVSSVAGRTGAVTLSSSDLTDWASTTSSFLTSSSDLAGAKVTGDISGKASGLTSTLGVASGGTGATTLTGIVKGNGTSAYTAAVSGVDYLQSSGATTNGNLALWNGSAQLVNGPAFSSSSSASSVVQRDASGNFAAGEITGTGLVTGSLRVTGGTPGTGKVLTSDDSGNATWATPNGTTQWTTSGSDISYSTGNVGIGTAAPNGNLQIHATTGANPTMYFSDADVTHGMTAIVPETNIVGAFGTGDTNGTGFRIKGLTGSNLVPALQLDAYTSSTPTTPAVVISGRKRSLTNAVDLAAGETLFQLRNGITPVMTALGSGNLGIGTTAPQQTLEVNGTVGIGSSFDTTGALAKLDVRGVIGAESGTAVPNGIIAIGNPMSDTEMMSLGVAGGANRYSWIQSRANNSAAFNSLVLNPSGGNIGIGMTSPDSKLTLLTNSIDGKPSAYFIDTNDGGVSDLLTLHKQTASGSAGLHFTQGPGSGNDIGRIMGGTATAFNITSYARSIALNPNNATAMTLTTTGNVGIGTTTPAQKLSVAGTIESTSGGFKFPDGTTQSTAASGGGDLSAPGAIGATTPNTGAFTTLSSSSGVTSTAAAAAISATAAPSLIGTSALVQLGSGGFAGGGGVNFAGSASGTALACNMEPAFAGNFADFQVSGTSKFTVSSAGNAYFAGSVGIGTANPLQPLHVVGGVPRFQSTTGAQAIMVDAAGGGYDASVLFTNGGTTKGKLYYKHANTAMTITDANNADLMTLKAGNVGIGNTNPTAKLHVSGKNIFGSTQTSGSGVSTWVTQTQPNATDTGDGALSTAYTIQATSATNQLVTRALGFSAVNNLTGGGHVEYLRALNLALGTNAGAVTDNAMGVFVEQSTSAGSGTNAYGVSVGGNFGIGFQNTYGFYIGAGTIGGTNKWQLYAGDTAPSFFGGNVGIGTTTPVTKLDARGTNAKGVAAYEDIFQVASTDAVSPLALRMGIRTTGTTTSRYGGIEVDDAGTKRALVLQPNGGNVGIGTASPEKLLHVKGDQSGGVAMIERSVAGNTDLPMDTLNLKTTTTGDMVDGFGNSINFLIQDNAGITNNIGGFGAFRDGADNSGGLFFGATNAGTQVTALTVRRSGNVGIGTTTPNEKLEVNGNIRITPLNGGGTTTASIDNNGNIVRTASDERLKKNIQPLENSLEKLLNLRGVSYQWKNRSSWGEEREIGFVAQELETVVPEVVRRSPDAAQTRSVNLPNLIALVVEAVKEFHAKHLTQERAIASVQSENKVLKERLEKAEKDNAVLRAYLCGKDPAAAFCQ